LNFKSHFKDFVIDLKLNTNAMGVTVTTIALIPDLTLKTPQTFNAVYVDKTDRAQYTLDFPDREVKNSFLQSLLSF
jgi:hypothetical protein